MTNPKHTDTSRSGDLVERLRKLRTELAEMSDSEFAVACSGEFCEDNKNTIEGCIANGLDRIEALEAENERLRGKVSQAILYFDDVAGLTENPLYDPLEVGFRHSPLSPKEREERYATACSAAWQSAQHGLAALGEKQ